MVGSKSVDNDPQHMFNQPMLGNATGAGHHYQTQWRPGNQLNQLNPLTPSNQARNQHRQ
ncbi:hypothetical protein QMZ65_22175 [Pantoea sp. EABMAA-21]|uniref:hypothetical protein n=1 Tax=Pantoea sp. EABMAA-21 TaxID=3043302 RepID=UPI0024B5B98C|nr:hypothetical protein [Pantoea sp. EABMAA-21]MDI9279931.1 hypothetical protein [Pantoea sp. EABMAA-21]